MAKKSFAQKPQKNKVIRQFAQVMLWFVVTLYILVLTSFIAGYASADTNQTKKGIQECIKFSSQLYQLQKKRRDGEYSRDELLEKYDDKQYFEMEPEDLENLIKELYFRYYISQTPSEVYLQSFDFCKRQLIGVEKETIEFNV